MKRQEELQVQVERGGGQVGNGDRSPPLSSILPPQSPICALSQNESMLSMPSAPLATCESSIIRPVRRPLHRRDMVFDFGWMDQVEWSSAGGQGDGDGDIGVGRGMGGGGLRLWRRGTARY